MTSAATARVNRLGSPCPPWCVTDHARYGFHGAEPVTVYAPQFHSCRIRAIENGFPGLAGQTHVEVAAAGMLHVSPRDAGILARLVEQLATATPDQHRELAAAIRQAAAVITEAGAGGRRPAAAQGPGAPRNGLPESPPYVYRGTGEDILLGSYGDPDLDGPAS